MERGEQEEAIAATPGRLERESTRVQAGRGGGEKGADFRYTFKGEMKACALREKEKSQNNFVCHD